ncbi:hypothetical protein [Chromobacterium vaccinii]|uniref:hypothetical protein n=1 Tax=Chromobacterium vaccinii TaxID=1108595 RepID=UPI0011860B19|nr:hypothetical protein [Chromobacterium vaccinii]
MIENKEALFEFLMGKFPSFKEQWTSEGNCNVEQDGGYTCAGLCAEFSQFFIDRFSEIDTARAVGWAKLAKPNVYREKYDDLHGWNLFVLGKHWVLFHQAQATSLIRWCNRLVSSGGELAAAGAGHGPALRQPRRLAATGTGSSAVD